MAYNPRYKYDASGKLEGRIESYEDAAAKSQFYVMLIKLVARLSPAILASVAAGRYLIGKGVNSFASFTVGLLIFAALYWLQKRYPVIQLINDCIVWVATYVIIAIVIFAFSGRNLVWALGGSALLTALLLWKTLKHPGVPLIQSILKELGVEGDIRL